MSIRLLTRALTGAALGALLMFSSPGTIAHASPRKLLDDSSIAGGSSKRHVPSLRDRKTKGHPNVLTDSDVIVNLFDDLQLTVHKTGVEKYLTDHYVWHGKTDEGDIVTIALVRGVMTVTIQGSGRSFEVAPAGNGTYVVSELDSASFPAEDAAGDNADPIVLPAGDVAGAADTTGTSAPAGSADTTGGATIDTMVLWTPAARNAVGGSVDAIQSLVLSAVANANLAFTNSGVNAQYRLVYSGELNFAESTSAISTDLSTFSTNATVKSLRTQYGADVVTLLGSGYASAGSCGYGYIMSTVSTSFSPYAYNVVDQSCAAGYLSYAHENGHNEGLQHDPANAGSVAPSYAYAYGYQDPAGQFRTVMSYGGQTRIPYFSSPLASFNGTPTGISSQDNARALNNNVTVVSNFVAATDGSQTTPVQQPCTYTVSTSAVSFAATAASVSVSVTTQTGCGWTTSSNASWATVTAGTSGSATAKISVTSNAGAARSATVTIAGQAVTVSQAAQPPCSFTVSPGSLSLGSGVTSGSVSVTTGTGCTWTTSSSTSWLTVTAGKSGSGTVKVSATANSGAARSGSVTVAGKAITVAQAAKTTKRK